EQKEGPEPLAVAVELPPGEQDGGVPVVDDRGRLVACLSEREEPQQLVRYAADVSEGRAFVDAARPWYEPRTAEDHRRRAALYARSRRLDRALADLDAALRQEPRHAPTWCERGRVRLMRADASKAAEDCDEALRLDGRLAAAHALRAEV